MILKQIRYLQLPRFGSNLRIIDISSRQLTLPAGLCYALRGNVALRRDGVRYRLRSVIVLAFELRTTRLGWVGANIVPHCGSALVQNIIALAFLASAHEVGLAQGFTGYHVVVVVAAGVALRLGDLVLGASSTLKVLAASLSVGWGSQLAYQACIHGISSWS